MISIFEPFFYIHKERKYPLLPLANGRSSPVHGSAGSAGLAPVRDNGGGKQTLAGLGQTIYIHTYIHIYIYIYIYIYISRFLASPTWRCYCGHARELHCCRELCGCWIGTALCGVDRDLGDSDGCRLPGPGLCPIAEWPLSYSGSWLWKVFRGRAGPCVCSCVRACMRACVRACVRVNIQHGSTS